LGNEDEAVSVGVGSHLLGGEGEALEDLELDQGQEGIVGVFSFPVEKRFRCGSLELFGNSVKRTALLVSYFRGLYTG